MAANSKPILLAESVLETGTLTATDTATSYYVDSLIDRRCYTFWQAASAGTKYITVNCGSAKSADCLGIIGHNFLTASATVSVESSANGADWTERLAGFTVTTNKCILKTFTTASAQYWRIKIVTAAVAARMSVAMIGARLTFERYPAGNLDPFPENINAESSRSKTGNLLGSTLRFISSDIKWDFRGLTTSWFESTFRPAWDAHLSLLKPFFVGWDVTNHATEVYYVKIPDDFQLSAPFNPYRRDVSLTFEGIKE